eukprot:ctg_3676.g804
MAGPFGPVCAQRGRTGQLSGVHLLGAAAEAEAERLAGQLRARRVVYLAAVVGGAGAVRRPRGGLEDSGTDVVLLARRPRHCHYQRLQVHRGRSAARPGQPAGGVRSGPRQVDMRRHDRHLSTAGGGHPRRHRRAEVCGGAARPHPAASLPAVEVLLAGPDEERRQVSGGRAAVPGIGHSGDCTGRRSSRPALSGFPERGEVPACRWSFCDAHPPGGAATAGRPLAGPGCAGQRHRVTCRPRTSPATPVGDVVAGWHRRAPAS